MRDILAGTILSVYVTDTFHDSYWRIRAETGQPFGDEGQTARSWDHLDPSRDLSLSMAEGRPPCGGMADLHKPNVVQDLRVRTRLEPG
jgi:hypothetical protein